jgi:hypothetical protein
MRGGAGEGTLPGLIDPTLQEVTPPINALFETGRWDEAERLVAESAERGPIECAPPTGSAWSAPGNDALHDALH